MRLIILSINQYKEKDAIVDALSEEGPITFLAKGIFNPKNKNSSLNTSLVSLEAAFQEGNYKYPVLKEISNVVTPVKVSSDLTYLGCLMLISEVTKYLLQDEEKTAIFPLLQEAVNKIKTSNFPLLVTLSYISQILKNIGYEFEVNSCVFCGSKKNISAFSFNDGGFICLDCNKEINCKAYTVKQMLLIRELFNEKNILDKSNNYSNEDGIIILNDMNIFIKDNIGFDLKSVSVINL